jgi:hypothetical protein
MKKWSSLVPFAKTLCLITLLAPHTTLDAQQVKYKMTTDIPASITTPDAVETSLGTLRFFDGFPDDATVQRVYDNLDFQRGVQAFLTALPVAVFHAMRAGYRTIGPDNQTVLITESLMDSRTLYYGANTETMYTLVWLNSKEGPLVIELPPNVLGIINDFWGRYVADLGKAGQDKGKGGRYLLLPPGYTGSVPDGYFAIHSRTYGNTCLIRSFIENGDLQPAIKNIKQHFRIYALAQVSDPPEITFVDISGKPFSSIAVNDASFFDNVASVIQEEPLDAVEPEVRGLLASIGIKKGESFAPDNRMKGILAESAAVGNATARSILFSSRDPDAFYYPNSAWQTGWIGGYDFSPGGVLNPDARTLLFYLGWGVSPAMTVKIVGLGSQYAIAFRDAAGEYLDGGKTYRLHLPAGIPAKDFWSVQVHDSQTRSLLQTDQQYPSCSSLKKDLIVNPDSSVDIFFGPKPPFGTEVNWIQTIRGKGWYIGLRLYGPLEPWFDKTWKPGEIELVK